MYRKKELLPAVQAVIHVSLIVAVLLSAVSCMSATKIATASVQDIQKMSKTKRFIQYRDDTGSNPLVILIQNGNVQGASYLIEQHVFDLNDTNAQNKTAISEAVTYHHTELVRLLITYGADTAIHDAEKNNLLHSAIIASAPIDILELLLNAGVDFAENNTHGETPLFTAFSKNDKNAVQVLTGRGASISDTDNAGNTLFHIAVTKNTRELLPFLTASTLSPDQVNNKNVTPLQLAIERNSRYWVETLIAAGCSFQKPFAGTYPVQYAVRTGSHNALAALIAHHADITMRDAAGETLLHAAVKTNLPAVINTIIQAAQLDIDVRDAHGQTPLMYAFFNGYETAGELLIQHGADLYAADSDGTTAAAIRRNYYLQQATLSFKLQFENEEIIQQQTKQASLHTNALTDYLQQKSRLEISVAELQQTYDALERKKNAAADAERSFRKERDGYRKQRDDYTARAAAATDTAEKQRYTESAAQADKKADTAERRRKNAETNSHITGSRFFSAKNALDAEKTKLEEITRYAETEEEALQKCRNIIAEKKSFIESLKTRIEYVRFEAERYPLSKSN